MVRSCCAVGCKNRHSSESDIVFYRFPVDPDRRNRWVAAIKRESWEPTEYSFVCSVHFVSGRKSQDPLSPDFVPSIFDHVGSPAKRKRARDLKKYTFRKRLLKKRILMVKEHERKKQEIEEKERRAKEEQALSELKARESAANALLELAASGECTADDSGLGEYGLGESTPPSVFPESTNVQTDMTASDIQQLEDNCQKLTEKYAIAEKYLLTEKGFRCNDEQFVKFYTGLPSYNRLKAVFDLASGTFLEKHENSSLSLFQQFILTLIKLRLNLRDQDLGFRFNVCQSTVSRVFHKWIDILYIRLKPTIQWPTRESVAKTMPIEFRRNFSRCICIIDCFEVFCERPSDQMARAQTFSNYKHHNTVKFLIAITPQGVVLYISKGWGGRVSDKYLTENCGLLNYLEPGDIILADRGFTVQDSVGICCAEVKTPPFTKGKKQLSQPEVDTARQLSRVRIHVERVIGAIRQKYSILESMLNINMIMCDSTTNVSLIDKIVVVCAALYNCCDSVVPIF